MCVEMTGFFFSVLEVIDHENLFIMTLIYKGSVSIMDLHHMPIKTISCYTLLLK